jgi:F-type H+-transporting ATPase subunit b
MKRLFLAAFLLTASAVWIQAQEKEHAESGTHAEESGDKWIVWKWANFAILAGGLGFLLAKNLPPFFRSRTEAIQHGISEAQQMKRDAEKRAAEMDQRLLSLGADVERFRKQAHAEMEQEGERIRQETAKQIAKTQQQAQEEIEAAGKTARRELKLYAAQLAFDLAERRIRARVDEKTEAALTDDFIRDLQKQGSRN